jgi:divalent metal cation (Fe/Co/Zn/Cd) transporter
MDTAPPIHIWEEVKSAASKVNGVMAIDKCFVRKMGLEFFVDIHVVVDRNLPVHIGHLIGHNVKDELMKFNPKISDVLVHIEPTPLIT